MCFKRKQACLHVNTPNYPCAIGRADGEKGAQRNDENPRSTLITALAKNIQKETCCKKKALVFKNNVFSKMVTCGYFSKSTSK